MRHLLLPLLVFCAILPCRASAQQIPLDGRTDTWEGDARQNIWVEQWDEAIRILDPVLAASPHQLEARLLRAICHREKARVVFDRVRAQYHLDPPNLEQTRQAANAEALGRPWRLDVGRDYDVAHAIFDFEFILAQDSSYDNVLYEYAQLWHAHHVFDRAISLGEAQIAVRPDAPDAHNELIAAYRHYIAWTPPDKALAWLQQHASSYSEYFIGEIYRREGRLDQADFLFAVLQERSIMPSQPILLSRARVQIAKGQLEAAYPFIEEALKFDTVTGARLLLTDFSYIMDQQEYEEAKTLAEVDEYVAFYNRMLTRRNPTPASRINWRLIEHYRRLVVAEREYAYFGPRIGGGAGHYDDPRGYVDASIFPPMYLDAHGFNDKGLIYVRHGDPDERVRTQPRPEVSMNESWRYRAENLDFHFYISDADGVAYSWPLVPLLTNCYMAVDRRHWGGFYNQMAPRQPCGPKADPRNQHDLNIATSSLTDSGNAAIAQGLTTDRHTWPDDEIESFDYPFDVVTFRNADGTTDVSVYLALPVGHFGESVTDDTLRVELGFAMHDTAWHPVAKNAVIREYVSGKDRSQAAFEEMHFTAPPDSYHVSLHADLLDSPLLSGYRLDRRIPDYNREETMMSDVVLAYDIRPRPGHLPSRRSSLQITQNPFHRFDLNQPVHVFFELYHLALDDQDVAQYDVTYQIEPQEQESGIPGLFRRLFRKKAAALSASVSFEDTTPSPIVFSQIDVSELAAGVYNLVVLVTDTASGKELERRIPLELTERDS